MSDAAGLRLPADPPACPASPGALPAAWCEERGPYRVRFATSAADVEAIQELRYEVFNLELGEGLEASHATRRDQDEFDRQCHHLVVEGRRDGAVLGTYRLQTAAMAGAGAGYYCAGEFDLGGLGAKVLATSAEIGRACVARDHRNTTALYALWRGLAAYLEHNGLSGLFGCCSLTSQDPLVGRRTLEHLSAAGHLHPGLRTVPLPGFECHPEEGDLGRSVAVEVPPLFALYLRIGARVCGAPAIDRAFKTIDFLVHLDVRDLDDRTRRLFFT